MSKFAMAVPLWAACRTSIRTFRRIVNHACKKQLPESGGLGCLTANWHNAKPDKRTEQQR